LGRMRTSMRQSKFNLYHAVVVSLVLHGLFLITANKGWVFNPVRSVIAPDPEPIRFTLVETEPSPDANVKENAVLSDVDRVASSPEPVQREENATGTEGEVKHVTLAPPAPEQRPGKPFVPRPPARPAERAPSEEKAPEKVLSDDGSRAGARSPSRERLSLLESMYLQKPPERVIAEGPAPSPPVLGDRAGRFGPVQFDAKGFDFGPYARRMVEIVKRNWYAIMPWAARWGAQGKVRLRFVLKRDGSVSDLEVVSSSDSVPLDRAALGSINLSTPFMPLPSEFNGDEVGVTFTYYYNMPVDGD
jgi:protein TonB